MTWIGLPLFFLCYLILLGFLSANLRWTMFVFINVNPTLYPVSTSKRNSSKDLELFKWSSCRWNDQVRSQLTVGIKSWTNLKTLWYLFFKPKENSEKIINELSFLTCYQILLVNLYRREKDTNEQPLKFGMNLPKISSLSIGRLRNFPLLRIFFCNLTYVRK